MFCKKFSNYTREFCKLNNDTELNCFERDQREGVLRNQEKIKLTNTLKKIVLYGRQFIIEVNESQTQLSYLSIINNHKNASNLLDYFPNLVTLIFKSNSVSKITGKMEILQYLDLSENRITEVKFLGEKLKAFRLRYLDLSKNLIRRIPETFKEFTQLIVLKITDCKILDIHQKAFIQNNSIIEEFHFNNTDYPTIQSIRIIEKMKRVRKLFSK